MKLCCTSCLYWFDYLWDFIELHLTPQHYFDRFPADRRLQNGSSRKQNFQSDSEELTRIWGWNLYTVLAQWAQNVPRLLVCDFSKAMHWRCSCTCTVNLSALQLRHRRLLSNNPCPAAPIPSLCPHDIAWYCSVAQQGYGCAETCRGRPREQRIKKQKEAGGGRREIQSARAHTEWIVFP